MKIFLKNIIAFSLLCIGTANASIILSVSNSAPDTVKIDPYNYTELQDGSTTVASDAQNIQITFSNNTINTIAFSLNARYWSGAAVRVPLAAFPIQNGKKTIVITYTPKGANQITLKLNASDANGVQYKGVFTLRPQMRQPNFTLTSNTTK